MSEIMLLSKVIIIFIMSLIMSMASTMCMFDLIEVGDLLIILMLYLGFLAVIFHLENKYNE